MPESKREVWAGRIQALLYPVQFEEEPLRGLDRVIDMVVRKKAELIRQGGARGGRSDVARLGRAGAPCGDARSGGNGRSTFSLGRAGT